MDRKEIVKKLSSIYGGIGLVALIGGFFLILIPTMPYIWYAINPKATDQEIERISEDILDSEDILKDSITQSRIPEVNPELPKDPYVKIDRIGVMSPVQKGDNYISILTNGAWMVPEFGDPINNEKTIIIAAHRFGYSYWSREERSLVSFYNLPKTDIGDIVSIIWDQREFVYEIYKGEESTYITDYDADLILYTCKYFNSPIRIFRYARAIY